MVPKKSYIRYLGTTFSVTPCIVRYAYSAEELEQVTLWDVANTDHAVTTIHTLAAGDQPFFFVIGFHKVSEGLQMEHTGCLTKLSALGFLNFSWAISFNLNMLGEF